MKTILLILGFGLAVVWAGAPLAADQCPHTVKQFKDCEDVQPCAFTTTECGVGKKETVGCETETYSICISQPESYKACTEVGSNAFCQKIGGCRDITENPPQCPTAAPPGNDCEPQTETTTTNITACAQ